MPGSQKVRGSNPLGSTKFLNTESTIWRSMQIREGLLTDYLTDYRTDYPGFRTRKIGRFLATCELTCGCMRLGILSTKTPQAG